MVEKAKQFEVELNGTAHGGRWPRQEWDVIRVVGHQVFEDILRMAPGREGRPSEADSWAYDVRDRSAPYYERYPHYAGKGGTAWPHHEMKVHLDRAAAQNALVFYPIETWRAVGRDPWRYQIRRRRVDPVSVRAMRPDYKANLWCDVETFEGCSLGLTRNARNSMQCDHRSELSEAHAPIKCDASLDPRVRAKDVRPPSLRSAMPSLVPDGDDAVERERDSPLDGRLKVDVLYSVISKGDEDAVDVAETWLEYCATCVLVYEVGPTGNPGKTYDRLKAHVAPSVFDRIIVNPKRGLSDPFRPPLLYRHLHNIKYARCFVAPLRVMMVAVDEAPCRPGLGEYLLRHSTNSLLDAAQLVAETRTDEYTWIETHFLGPGPRFIAAAQHLLYLQIQPPVQPALLTTREGHPAPAPPEEVHNAAHYCTGKALARQAPVMLTGPLSFEGTWYTGRQWRKVSSAFKLGYWLHDAEPLEYTLLHSPMAEDEIRRLYLPDTAWNITSSTKPPGRNTCYNPSPPRLHVPAMSAAKVKDALESMSAVQFSIKGVAPTLDDAARSYLAEKRRRDVGKQAGAKRQAATRKPAATEPDS